MAQQAQVTELISKGLAEVPGKEALMITVEYPPGGADPIHRHNAQAICIRAGGVRDHAGEGREAGDADTRTDVL